MTYGPAEAADDITTLQSFWNGEWPNYIDVVTAMQNLTTNGDTSDDPSDANAAAVKLVFASQEVFIDALTKEPQLDQARLARLILGHGDELVATGASLYKIDPLDVYGRFKGPPRYLMLNGILKATQAGWFSTGDPAGITPWVDFTGPAGDAVSRCLSSDPDPTVRGMMLALLKGSAFPVDWAQSILTGLGGLDDQVAASTWDASTRASLAALSKDVRARALNAANTANMATFTTGGGQPTQNVGVGPKPWYKRIELWGAAAGGVLAGVETFKKLNKPQR